MSDEKASQPGKKCPMCGAPSDDDGTGFHCGSHWRGIGFTEHVYCVRRQLHASQQAVAQAEERVSELELNAKQWDQLQADIEAANFSSDDQLIENVIAESKRQDPELARIPVLEEENERLRAIAEPLDRLRQAEGASVTVICPNPEFPGPAQAIEVCDEWTGWNPRRFSGETLADAFATAEAAGLAQGGAAKKDEQGEADADH